MKESKFNEQLKEDIEQLVDNLFWNTDAEIKQKMIYDFVKSVIAKYETSHHPIKIVLRK